MINFCDIKSAIDLVKSYTANKIVFWVGAGIDCNCPTNLPAAKPLLYSILEIACGKNIADNIKTYWENQGSRIHDILNGRVDFSCVPRFESVLRGIKDFESNLKNDSSVLSGFYSFRSALANSIHHLLAEYLNNGANTTTTNYDLCIPNAYNRLYHGTHCIEKIPKRISLETPLYRFESTNKDSSKLYYLHGVSTDPKSLGITLASVKNSLPIELEALLNQWIDEDYLFIFMGYSGSDTLDVNRYFLARYNINASNAKAIFICHLY